MIVKFHSIEINNFLSVGSISIDLSDKGLVSVLGINNSDSLARSNGSGKSSIFEAILWSLTGYTSRGVTDPTNIYVESGEECSVILKMSIDNIVYIIDRYRSGSRGNGISIFKDDEDISGKNLTSSKKVLESELGDINYSLLVSILIFSQGMLGSFSSLSPTSRKSLLESITRSGDYIELLRNKISKLESDYGLDLSSTNREVSELSSRISREQELIRSLNDSIAEYSSKTKFSDSDEYIRLREEYDTASKLYESYMSNVSDLSSKLSIIDLNIKSKEENSISTKSKMAELESSLSNLKFSECPTCHQEIKDLERLNSMKSSITEEYSALFVSSLNLESEIEALYESRDSTKSELSNLESSKVDSSSLRDISNKLAEFSSRNDTLIESSNQEISNSESKIEEFSSRLVSSEAKLSDLEEKSDIVKFLKSLIARDFRSYLLVEVVEYLNSKLEVYSKYLFDLLVRLQVEGNNIDLYLGSKKYEMLSGGERRRVDLVMQLSLRDLYINQTGLSFNILVLDEVLDHLDESGISSVLSLLKSKSSSIDSIYVVSHKADLPIEFDNTLVVEKNSDNITKLVE